MAEPRREYFQEYYSSNKQQILDRKKTQYKQEQLRKASQRERQARSRAKKKAMNPTTPARETMTPATGGNTGPPPATPMQQAAATLFPRTPVASLSKKQLATARKLAQLQAEQDTEKQKQAITANYLKEVSQCNETLSAAAATADKVCEEAASNMKKLDEKTELLQASYAKEATNKLAMADLEFEALYESSGSPKQLHFDTVASNVSSPMAASTSAKSNSSWLNPFSWYNSQDNTARVVPLEEPIALGRPDATQAQAIAAVRDDALGRPDATQAIAAVRDDTRDRSEVSAVGVDAARGRPDAAVRVDGDALGVRVDGALDSPEAAVLNDAAQPGLLPEEQEEPPLMERLLQCFSPVTKTQKQPLYVLMVKCVFVLAESHNGKMSATALTNKTKYKKMMPNILEEGEYLGWWEIQQKGRGKTIVLNAEHEQVRDILARG